MKQREQYKRTIEQLINLPNAGNASPKFPGVLVSGIAHFFVGTSYGEATLETTKAEHLVINLREFDCFTFVENVVAFACLLRSRGRSLESFRRKLLMIRYRQGRLKGYSSRLHYFSDWMQDNRKKGIVRDITAQIGGRPLRKTVTFMTAHPALYPALKDAATLRRMVSVERAISRRSLSFIPKRGVRRVEKRIRDGDLIAVTTSREGLDVQHVGVAARVEHRIHLLHASSKEGRVVLSKETLCRYLTGSETRTGIMVARMI